MYYTKEELEEKIKNGTIQEVIDHYTREKRLYVEESPEIIDSAREAYDSMFDDYLYEYLQDGINNAVWEIERIEELKEKIKPTENKSSSGFSKIKKLL